MDLEPQFTVGASYDASHKETIKLRILINDQFHAGVVEHPLTNVEYAVYKLKEKGERDTVVAGSTTNCGHVAAHFTGRAWSTSGCASKDRISHGVPYRR